MKALVFVLYFGASVAIDAQVAIAESASPELVSVLPAIDDTAEHLCGNVAQSGSRTKEEINGDVKASLSGLAKIVSDAGITGKGEITNEHFEGVLQEQLSATLKNTQDCKTKVLQLILDYIRGKNRDGAEDTPLPKQTNFELRGNLKMFLDALRRWDAEFYVFDQNELQEGMARNQEALLKPREVGQNATNFDPVNIGKEHMARMALHNADFETRFRSSAYAYFIEICKREEFIAPCPQTFASMNLKSGLLTGPRPILQIVDYLSEIGEKLPPVGD